MLDASHIKLRVCLEKNIKVPNSEPVFTMSLISTIKGGRQKHVTIKNQLTSSTFKLQC